VAKEKKNATIINGLRQPWPKRSWPAGGCDHSTTQTLCPIQSEAVAHSNLESPGEKMLASAYNAMERRIDGLLKDRTRIGRDLHDSVLQSLYAIGLNLEVARSTNLRPSQKPPRAHDPLVTQLGCVIQEVRAMIASLDSGMIQEIDLAAELKSLQTVYQESGRLRIDLDLPATVLEILTMRERGDILNIVREALSNCARHAGATHTTVVLSLERTTVRIRIVDNGQGFAPADTRNHGYGLANMEARARQLGGELHVHSAIGQGTAITVDFALPLTPAGL